MHLDSVRELKASVLQREFLRVADSRTRAFGVTARRVGPASRCVRTIAVGVSVRKKQDFALAIRIQHRALENSPEVERIRKGASGEVDVQYIGRVVTCGGRPWYQGECRPLRIGCSIGHPKIGAGTRGCFVRKRGEDSGQALILSNNHVLAAENRGRKGDAILQPGPHDGGGCDDSVAALGDFARLRSERRNGVDCAVAHIHAGVDFDPRKLNGLGKVRGIGPGFIDAGTRVAKIGRTTGLTRGRVTAIELDNLVVTYSMGELRFDSQLEFAGSGDGAFSQSGDSGSLIVDEAGFGAALLFAGSDQGGPNGKGLSYGNPLNEVFGRLGVEFLL